MADLGFTCVLHPGACISNAVAAHLWEALFAAFLAGMVAGALLGKAIVAAIVIAIGALMFWRRSSSSDDVAENVDGEDAKPSHPKPKKPRDAPDVSGIFGGKKH